MATTRCGVFAAVLGLAVALGGAVSAQDKKAWPPKEIKSGGKAWGIYMKPPKLEAIPDKGILVAEADSEEEAKKLSDAFFKDENNKFPKDLFTALKKDNGYGDQPTLTLDMLGGKKFVVPLSNVDPKPLPKAKPPILDLTGKKAKGKLGDWNVTFEFQKGNKLVITGDVEGEGEWGLTEEKLTMATKLAVFLGAVDKDGKMKGKRVKRDGKELLEWSAIVEIATERVDKPNDDGAKDYFIESLTFYSDGNPADSGGWSQASSALTLADAKKFKKVKEEKSAKAKADGDGYYEYRIVNKSGDAIR